MAVPPVLIGLGLRPERSQRERTRREDRRSKFNEKWDYLVLATGRLGLDVTRSELEDRFLRFLAEAGLQRPRKNAAIAAGKQVFEVDCAWRRSGVVVELDGRAFHDTVGAFERDRARDRALNAAGWRVVRVTWRQLDSEPAALAADLHTLLCPPGSVG